jgi:hypothetical protein
VLEFVCLSETIFPPIYCTVSWTFFSNWSNLRRSC